MMATTTQYEHVVQDEQGIVRIAGTQLRVIDLVEAKLANDWTPEELYEQHPELTLGQIYSALAYYWDHQQALDAAMVQRRQEVEALRQQTRPSRLVRRLQQDSNL